MAEDIGLGNGYTDPFSGQDSVALTYKSLNTKMRIHLLILLLKLHFRRDNKNAGGGTEILSSLYIMIMPARDFKDPS